MDAHKLGDVLGGVSLEVGLVGGIGGDVLGVVVVEGGGVRGLAAGVLEAEAGCMSICVLIELLLVCSVG